MEDWDKVIRIMIKLQPFKHVENIHSILWLLSKASITNDLLELNCSLR